MVIQMSNNAKIEITTTEETRVNGKPIYKDKPFYNLWAEILDMYGKELYEAINIKLEHTIVFKVKYCKKLKELRAKKEYKVFYDNNIYKIYYTDFSKYPKKYVLLKCNLIK